MVLGSQAPSRSPSSSSGPSSSTSCCVSRPLCPRIGGSESKTGIPCRQRKLGRRSVTSSKVRNPAPPYSTREPQTLRDSCSGWTISGFRDRRWARDRYSTSQRHRRCGGQNGTLARQVNHRVRDFILRAYLQAGEPRRRIPTIGRIGPGSRLKPAGESGCVTREANPLTRIKPLFFPTDPTSERAQSKDQH